MIKSASALDHRRDTRKGNVRAHKIEIGQAPFERDLSPNLIGLQRTTVDITARRSQALFLVYWRIHANPANFVFQTRCTTPLNEVREERSELSLHHMAKRCVPIVEGLIAAWGKASDRGMSRGAIVVYPLHKCGRIQIEKRGFGKRVGLVEHRLPCRSRLIPNVPTTKARF